MARVIFAGQEWGVLNEIFFWDSKLFTTTRWSVSQKFIVVQKQVRGEVDRAWWMQPDVGIVIGPASMPHDQRSCHNGFAAFEANTMWLGKHFFRFIIEVIFRYEHNFSFLKFQHLHGLFSVVR